MTSWIKTTPRLLAALALLLAAAGCDSTEPVDERVRTQNFVLTDSEGADFKLSDTQGKVVLLHFFSTTCGACNQQMPDMVALHKAYADQGLVIVGISSEGPSVLAAHKAENKLPYRVLTDPGRLVTNAYRVQGTPTNVLIERSGYIFDAYPNISKQDFDPFVQALLKRAP